MDKTDLLADRFLAELVRRVAAAGVSVEPDEVMRITFYVLEALQILLHVQPMDHENLRAQVFAELQLGVERKLWPQSPGEETTRGPV